MRVEACLYNVRIIGIAASNLPKDIKAANEQIPWLLLEETKAKLTHDRFDTDIQHLWNFIKFELPSLVKKLTRLYGELAGTDV